MNLYQILELEGDATKDEIKKSFRKIMMGIHPDVNGGVEHPDHDAIQHAYDVLSDDERRKKYDETGDESEGIDISNEARSMLAQLFIQAMNSENAMEVNLQEVVKGVLADGITDSQKQIAGIAKNLSKLEAIAKRTKAKGRMGFISGIFEKGREQCKSGRLQHEEQIKINQAAEEMIDDLQYEVEIPEQRGRGQQRGMEAQNNPMHAYRGAFRPQGW